MLEHGLSYSSLSLWGDCRYQWFGRYILGLKDQGSVAQKFGIAVDEALSESNRVRMEKGIYLEPEIVTAIFRDSFETDLPEHPGFLMSELDPYWRGETPELLLDKGEELIHRYYAGLWVEEDDSFTPLKSADQIRPEGVQLRLEKKLSGEHVQKFVGVLDLLDLSGVVVDYKGSARPRKWEQMDYDLQPTSYSFLLGRPIDLQFIELVRGDRRCAIKTYVTVRTEDDIAAFGSFLEITAREMDERVIALNKEFGPVDSWREDTEAVKRAAAFFPPSPGRRCAFDGHFTTCHFRAGKEEL